MYQILFYRTQKGETPVLDYIRELSVKTSKDARIKCTKINDYIQALSTYGANNLPVQYAKHLDGEIWELRPVRDRILFAAIVGKRYLLLHQFMKKTQKTPIEEIAKARKELEDFKKRSELYG